MAGRTSTFKHPLIILICILCPGVSGSSCSHFCNSTSNADSKMSLQAVTMIYVITFGIANLVPAFQKGYSKVWKHCGSAVANHIISWNQLLPGQHGVTMIMSPISIAFQGLAELCPGLEKCETSYLFHLMGIYLRCPVVWVV